MITCKPGTDCTECPKRYEVETERGIEQRCTDNIYVKSTNPRFPYRMEKAKWYLMFLLLEKIISIEEFNVLYDRLPDEFK